MSLHAQLHPDALRALEVQQRRARATSIVIALLATALLFLILGFLAIRQVVEHHSPPAYFSVPDDRLQDPQPRPLDPTLVRQPTQPAGALNPVLVAQNRSELSVPTPDAPLPTDSAAFGDGRDGQFGDGERFGEKGGTPGGIPTQRQRCAKAERLARLAENGVGEEVDDAVLNTLRWFKSHQAADGSWGSQNKVGLTGLALLAYLGHCETPVSLEFGESCTNALVYLLDVGQRNNGKLASNFSDKHWPYEHAIATYALAEALSFAPLHGYSIPGHAEVVDSAGQWIVNNQHESGGWDYSYEESGDRGGDLSIVGWQLQALKACKTTGLDFRNLERCVREALAYVELRQASNGGFGYTDTTPAGGIDVHSLTAVGVLSLQIWDKAAHSAARKGIRYIADRTPFDYTTAHCDLYAHYYGSQAMMRHGGEAWQTYNRRFSAQLLAAQLPDGSFRKPGSGAPPIAVAASFAEDTPDGIHYRNCLAALMLEVYYRYLPATGQ